MKFDELPKEQKEGFLKAEKNGRVTGAIIEYILCGFVAAAFFKHDHPVIAVFVLFCLLCHRLFTYSQKPEDFLKQFEFFPKE